MSWLASVTYVDYLIVSGVLLFLAYIGSTWNYDYFAKRKIPFRKPVPLFGNQFRITCKLQSIAEWTMDNYDAFPGSNVFGIYEFLTPVLFVRYPEVLKAIAVKDFDHFTDHFNFIPDGIEPLFDANLLSLKGQKWRHMRNLLSPAFTSSKMKGMFHLISQCGQQLVDHLDTQIKKSGDEIMEMDMKDLFTRFTNDVIATSAFGISCDSLKNPRNEFYMCGKDITNFGGIRNFIFLAYLMFPRLMQMLNIKLFSKSSKDFLCKTVNETVEAREKNGIIRHDMIHLLMQAKKGELKSDEDEANNAESREVLGARIQKRDVTNTDITAQALIFFFAGFETTSVLLGFASLLLAIHQDVQERLQQEIDETLENCGGKLTYDALQSMKYLDMVVSETLRMYPPAPLLDRECVKPYTIPATDTSPAIHIKPKDLIFVPVYGFHHDPDHFPDPEKFDPERFSDENKHNIKPFTYMPFGLGPRACIGNRFALMEDKIALTYLLSRFSLHVTPKSSVPIKLSRANNFDMIPEKGHWIGLKKRESHVTD